MKYDDLREGNENREGIRGWSIMSKGKVMRTEKVCQNGSRMARADKRNGKNKVWLNNENIVLEECMSNVLEHGLKKKTKWDWGSSRD